MHTLTPGRTGTGKGTALWQILAALGPGARDSVPAAARLGLRPPSRVGPLRSRGQR